MTSRIVTACAGVAAFALSAAQAQQPAPPPVRQIGTVTGASRDSLASVAAAVEVAGGRIYVNDIIGHRVLLYDSTLANAVVVADSDATSPNAYGARPGTLLPYHGDSALFVTPGSLSMLVLNPAGQIVRVMAMPPANGGLPALIGSIFGTPGFDAGGRLVYFSPVRMEFRGPPPSDGRMSMEPPDSALVVRFDFANRTLDTAAAIRIPRSRSSVTRDDRGQMHISMTAFPPATVDDWAVTSDGRLAVVRGRDYHVDWLEADGSWSASPRLPYAWQRLDDEQKTALVDSIAGAMQAMMDSMPARMQRATSGATGAAVETRGGAGAGGGGATMTIVMAPGGGETPSGGGPRPAGGPTSIQMSVPTVVKASPSDVPDYRPAFGQGAVRADRDGNLWIRTTTMADGRPVYDVVNRRGELTERVQLPPFRTIAGFGAGVVFLGVRDSVGVSHLERARIR